MPAMPYSRSAAFYDAIYSWKNYAAEVETLRALIRQYKRAPGRALLDVACGTAIHTQLLASDFEVCGVDLDAGMLAVARRRLPGTPFHQADMVDFTLDARFDVITCLFSSIGYVQTRERLFAAIASMARHLNAGGVLLIEPWFAPEQFIGGTPHATFIDQPDLKLARMNVSYVENGTISILDFHYLIATPAGVEHFTERHELGLFPSADYVAAFRAAGLSVTHDAAGVDGRGLYIGVRAA
jgi:ubiquinone/menaquinone biosynthesis C-methylase UbiE